MRIAIFGLGYTGAVSAACLADMGHNVVGVDINPDKVALINRGMSPIIETGIEELVAQGVTQERLRATLNAAEALARAEVSIVCVGTPSHNDGDLNLGALSQVCREIGQQLPNTEGYHVVVIRSTILPGTMEELVAPTLEEASRLKAGEDFGLCFNPEFLREGSSVYDFRHPPFTVVGADDPAAADAVANLYLGIEAPIIRTAVKTAEMVKFVSNAYHALKITFANEIGNVCKRQDIDSHEVMKIFIRDEKLNISAAYLKPGFAFGGSCLPKDVKALLHSGRHLDLKLPLLEAIIPSNEEQIMTGLRMITQTGRKRIGFLGFSFKAGTDDLRSSPQVELIERLIGKGYQVKVFDRHVSLARLYGANKAYIEKEIPHIATLMCATLEEVLAESEVIVIGNRDEAFARVPETALTDQIVIDLVRIADQSTSADGRYQGICW